MFNLIIYPPNYFKPLSETFYLIYVLFYYILLLLLFGLYAGEALMRKTLLTSRM